MASTILRLHASEQEDADKLVKYVEKLDTKEREYANSVLQIAVKHNIELFEKMKERLQMNYVLELFRPEVEAKVKAGREEVYQAVQKLREGKTAEQLIKSGMDRDSVQMAQKILL